MQMLVLILLSIEEGVALLYLSRFARTTPWLSDPRTLRPQTHPSAISHQRHRRRRDITGRYVDLGTAMVLKESINLEPHERHERSSLSVMVCLVPLNAWLGNDTHERC